MLSSLPLSIALLRLYCFIIAFYSYSILIRYLLSLPVHIMHFYCFLIAFVISLSPLCSPTSSSLSRHARHSDLFPYHTAYQEHSYLTCTPSPFFLLFTRPRTLHCRSPFLLAFLLLAGDTVTFIAESSFAANLFTYAFWSILDGVDSGYNVVVTFRSHVCLAALSRNLLGCSSRSF